MKVVDAAKLDSAGQVMETQKTENAALQARITRLQDSLSSLQAELDRRNKPVNGKPEFIRIPNK
jgi:hypothetical protein